MDDFPRTPPDETSAVPDDISDTTPPSASAAPRRPRRHKVVEPAQSLEDAIAAAFGVEDARDGKPNLSDRDFARLAKLLGAEGASAVGVLLESPKAIDSRANREALAIELCLAAPAIENSGSQSISWMRTHPDWATYAALAASRHITEKNNKHSSVAAVVRQTALSESHHRGLRAHPLLRVDEAGLWCPGTATADADEWRNAADVSPSVIDTSLPLGKEFRARRELLELGMMRRDVDGDEVGHRKAGTEALRRALEYSISLIAEPPPGDSSAWEMAMRPLDIVGQNPEIWNKLGSLRHRLISAEVSQDNQTLVGRWAQVVLATWCATKASLHDIEQLADNQLVALYGLCRAQSKVATLRNTLRSLLTQRMAQNEDTLFDRLTRLDPVARAEDEWLAALIADRQKKEARSALAKAAEHWPNDALLSPAFGELVAGESPQKALPAVARASYRLDEARRERERRVIASAVLRLREILLGIEQTIQRARDVLGQVPEPILIAASGATEACRRHIESITAVTADAGDGEQSAFVPQAEHAKIDLFVALRDLEFDPKRSAAEIKKKLRDAEVALSSEIRTASPLLGAVRDELERLPPEAIGLVWRLAVDARNEALLGSVSRILDAHPFARRQWEQIVLACSGSIDDAIPVDDTTARNTLNALRERMSADHEKSLHEERATLAVDGARASTDNLARSLQKIADDISALGRAITQVAANGSQTRS